MKGGEEGVLLCHDECESVGLVLWDCLVYSIYSKK